MFLIAALAYCSTLNEQNNIPFRWGNPNKQIINMMLGLGVICFPFSYQHPDAFIPRPALKLESTGYFCFPSL